MNKFYGAVGYAQTIETTPGVWQEKITEHMHYGDIVRNVGKTRDSENLNPNLTLENKLSIVADPFALENFHSMRYVNWMGALWQITSVEVQRPRLVLTIGGVYHEQTHSVT